MDTFQPVILEHVPTHRPRSLRRVWLAVAAALLGAVALALRIWHPVAPDAIPAIRRTPHVTKENAVVRALNAVSASPHGIAVVNPRHRAEFHPNGVTLHPTEGPQWNWTLKTLGAEGVHASVQPVEPRELDDFGVAYDRGAIEERYRFRERSVEQEFVLLEPLALDGRDLVIEGEVRCPGTFEQHSNGWTWRDASGVVSLGQVQVFDAQGRTLSASMTATATGTRITVDGGALVAAAYPVTVDPEIGTQDFRLSCMGPDGDITYDATDCDVAYNATNNEFLVVWSGSDDTPGSGMGQFEIFAQRISATTGAQLGTHNYRISDMGAVGDPESDAIQPAVAWNSVNNQYLVVWSGDDSTGVTANGENEVFGQRLDGVTGAEVGTNDFRISDMGPDGDLNFDAYSPALAYNTTRNEFLVVWQGDDGTAPFVAGECEIYAQRIAGATGLEVGTNDFRLSDMGPTGDPNYDALSPRVAWNATNDQYLVVWRGDDGAPLANDEFEVYGQLVAGQTGAEAGTNDLRLSDMGPNGAAAYDANEPAVTWSSTSNVFLVVWAGDDNTGLLVEGEQEVFGQLVSGSTGAETGTNDFRVSVMGPDGDPLYDAFLPAVAYASGTNEFLVTWAGDSKSNGLVSGEYEVFAQRVAGTGLMSGKAAAISSMGVPGHTHVGAFRPMAATRTVGTQEFLVTWHADIDTLGRADDEFEVYGQRLTASTGRETGTNDFWITDMGPDGDVEYDGANASVAWNSRRNQYLVVWEADDTLATMVDGEQEILGQIVDATTGAVMNGGGFRISHMGPDGSTSYDAQRPSVAYNSVRDEYLVVWSGETNTGLRVQGEFEVHGQRLSATGALLGTPGFRISDMGPDGNALFDAIRPRIAYDPLNDTYLVVWEGDDDNGGAVNDEMEVWGQRLTGDGIEFGANDFRITSMGPPGNPGFDALSPAVAFNSWRHEFLVVWAGDDSTGTGSLIPGANEIFGQRLDADGVKVGTTGFRISDMGPDSSAAFDAASPDVAFDLERGSYMVVWEGDDNSGLLVDGEVEVWGQTLDGLGQETGTNDFRISDVGPDGSTLFDATSPRIAFVPGASEFVVCWSGDDDTQGLVDGENEVLLQRLDTNGLELGVNDERISHMGPDSLGTYDAAQPCLAVAADRAQLMLAWHGDCNDGQRRATEFEAHAQRYELTPIAGVSPGMTARGVSLSFSGANPVRDRARLRLVAERSGSFAVQVIDVTGRVRLMNTLPVTAHQSVDVTLDTRDLAPGTYFVRVSQGALQASQRVVVLH